MLEGLEKNLLWVALFMSLASFSCSPISPPEPIPPFVEPIASIISVFPPPDADSTIHSDSVIVTYEGNEAVDSFKYRLDPQSDTSWIYAPPGADTIRYLDEGSHTFELLGISIQGVPQKFNKPAIRFFVDAVKGPSAMFRPRLKKLTSGMRSFTYDIVAEEVNDLFAAKLTLKFPPDTMQIDSIRFGDSVQSIVFDFSGINTIDNIRGHATINFALKDTTPVISGGFVIARLTCSTRIPGYVGAFYIKFDSDSTFFRDSFNSKIGIKNLVNGRVEVH